jgi:hypothetical protein
MTCDPTQSYFPNNICLTLMATCFAPAIPDSYAYRVERLSADMEHGGFIIQYPRYEQTMNGAADTKLRREDFCASMSYLWHAH